ncbi:hypothetical protein FCJ59_07460 [Cupriavidus basilensis]|nr:hypothetical protein [Cupriavidus basilensis]
MNQKRLIATLNTWFILGLASAFGAGCWAFVTAGVCRIAFHLEENTAMLFIGAPLFVVLLIWFWRILPKHLRKAGMLGDEPERFGPW